MVKQPIRPVASFFPHCSPHAPLSFGAVIAAARKAEAWSLQTFGEEIGTQRAEGNPVSPQFLNNVAHDRRMPSEDLLVAMATVLHLDADELRAVGRLTLVCPPVYFALSSVADDKPDSENRYKMYRVPLYVSSTIIPGMIFQKPRHAVTPGCVRR